MATESPRVAGAVATVDGGAWDADGGDPESDGDVRGSGDWGDVPGTDMAGF
ncbi:hypothetical protein GCM10010515_49140 [Streptomyces fructofermentans]|uniref:Uncharacterized protein n=1 Tax=Streptomyces fructofermentans TaxID=152141 RepID=A0A918NKL4_9ACTN|nr:hypothetical protein GCM10010515_49140 [Streptomyces fructofermentans]